MFCIINSFFTNDILNILAPEHGHMIPDNHADNSTAGPSRSRKAKSSMANSTAARGRHNLHNFAPL